MNAQLQIHLFGTPQFTYQGKPLTGFVSNKVRALLIYLASRAALTAAKRWPSYSGPIQHHAHMVQKLTL
ncbi:MAG: hypothetical protein KDE31_36960 [Caldilineaceae bacterium]|nr:hypothetical protein [Caldilineaceae bacterium]